MWYEGTIQLEANRNQLMQLAESYCKDAVLGGEWMKPSQDEQEIFALRAEFHDMQKAKVNKQQCGNKSEKDKESHKKGKGKRESKLTVKNRHGRRPSQGRCKASKAT